MLKDLLGDTLQGMLEAEMDEKLGYSKYDYKNKDTDDSRNGYSPKTVTSSMGPIDLDIPRDRKGEFEPKVVKKNQTDISDIEDQVLSMYAKGMTTRDISAYLRDVYGVNASAEMISHMTDRILPLAREWQNRPLERKYAIVFMDAVHFHVREDNRTVKKAVYVAIGTKLNESREVLGMWIGGNESAKYWLGVLNEIKNRGVEDIMIVSVDGLPLSLRNATASDLDLLPSANLVFVSIVLMRTSDPIDFSENTVIPISCIRNNASSRYWPRNTSLNLLTFCGFPLFLLSTSSLPILFALSISAASR